MIWKRILPSEGGSSGPLVLSIYNPSESSQLSKEPTSGPSLMPSSSPESMKPSGLPSNDLSSVPSSQPSSSPSLSSKPSEVLSTGHSAIPSTAPYVNGGKDFETVFSFLEDSGRPLLLVGSSPRERQYTKGNHAPSPFKQIRFDSSCYLTAHSRFQTSLTVLPSARMRKRSRKRNHSYYEAKVRSSELFAARCQASEVTSLESLLRICRVAPDPLKDWQKYIQYYKSKNDPEQEFQIQQRCVRSCIYMPQYKDSVEFVKVFILYVKMCQDPLQEFKLAWKCRVGRNMAMFWMSWTWFAEKAGNYRLTLKLFEESLQQVKGEKMTVVKERFVCFKLRMRDLRIDLDSLRNDVKEKVQTTQTPRSRRSSEVNKIEVQDETQLQKHSAKVVSVSTTVSALANISNTPTVTTKRRSATKLRVDNPNMVTPLPSASTSVNARVNLSNTITTKRSHSRSPKQPLKKTRKSNANSTIEEDLRILQQQQNEQLLTFKILKEDKLDRQSLLRSRQNNLKRLKHSNGKLRIQQTHACTVLSKIQSELAAAKISSERYSEDRENFGEKLQATLDIVNELHHKRRN
ncbi:hypothetical protein CTEN210_04819 [Chaetoceros tenuissimus]|uniref:BUB1 N-terminal domain-containing protein n=1 Tax=Chaetoceros tenuissimus TaxID=426638 RepID=A0AAD3CMD6_9STRA|nr:hypothetical protein CTEN210_04819 [Chaetoceros tenuissimus]